MQGYDTRSFKVAVVAEGSVDSVLRGKQYNRGVRLYKIYYEALMRILLTNLSSETLKMVR